MKNEFKSLNCNDLKYIFKNKKLLALYQFINYCNKILYFFLKNKLRFKIKKKPYFLYFIAI